MLHMLNIAATQT